MKIVNVYMYVYTHIHKIIIMINLYFIIEKKKDYYINIFNLIINNYKLLTN